MENLIGQQIGSYTLLHSLGEGGMAEVFLAKNSLGKKFTIKVLKPELFSREAIKQRFINEAKVMLSLEHPHVRQVIDFHEDKNLMAIIMEYLDGADLDSYVEKNGPVPEKQVLEWFKQILPAFSYTHEQDIVHRDVKPSNIFLTKNNAIKVLDFGIAKIIDNNLNLTGTTSKMGTPMYMSPEQIQTPKDVDYRTDIYSLGVTLYVLLTGRKPYDDATDSEYWIQTQIVNEPLPQVLTIAPYLNQAIAKATAKNRNERYQSCELFLKDLLAGSKGVIEEKLMSKIVLEKKIISMPSPKIKAEEKSKPVQRPTPWAKYIAIFFGTIILVFAILAWIGTYYSKEDEVDDDSEVAEIQVDKITCRLVRVSFSDGSFNKFEYNPDGTLKVATTMYNDPKGVKNTSIITVSYNDDGLAVRYTYTYNQAPNGYTDLFYTNGAISEAEVYEASGKLYQKMEFITDSNKRIVKQKNTTGQQAGAYFNYYYDDQGNITKWEQVDAKDKTTSYTLYSNYDDKYCESNSIKKGLPFNPVDGLPFMTNNYQVSRFYQVDDHGVLQLKEESILSDFQYNSSGFITSNRYVHTVDKLAGSAKSTYDNCQ
ncbi:serine/threonine-protein kinase [Runella aurantiaca]|nr:serine/threonine-protein kinase [Runella aurantiaca]